MTPMYLWTKLIKKLRGSSIINSRVHPTSKVESGSHIVNTVFDRHSFCGYDCEIINCEIGSFCSISNNVKIGGGRHPIEWVGMSPVFYYGRDSVKAKFSTHQREAMKKTIIEHDVWIGEGVIIKAGITIGNGSIVGMGSIVTRDVEDYSIVAGNPAREIRKRFDEQTINKLLEIKWWNFSDEQLYKYAKFFTNPAEFIREVEKNV